MELTVTIEGMHCEACVSAVTSAVKSLAGVRQCDVSVGEARISYDDQAVAKAGIFAAIRQAGSYDVTGFTVSE